MPGKRKSTGAGEETQRKRGPQTRAKTKEAGEGRDRQHQDQLTDTQTNTKPKKSRSGKTSAKGGRMEETPTNEATTVPAGTGEASTHLTDEPTRRFTPINDGTDTDLLIHDPSPPPRDQSANAHNLASIPSGSLEQEEPKENGAAEARPDLLALFLDPGNSRIEAAFSWGREPPTWFDKFNGEGGGFHIPNLVTAYETGGSWKRSFGWAAMMHANQVEEAVMFEHLKMNTEPDSEYLQDQVEKEKKVGYSDNWTFLMEGVIGIMLDHIIGTALPPKVVLAYVGPPAGWKAKSVGKYLEAIRPPPRWADKFLWRRYIQNEGFAAARSRLVKMSYGQRLLVVDIGHGSTVCLLEIDVFRMLI